jgi:hypothetical protein
MSNDTGVPNTNNEMLLMSQLREILLKEDRSTLMELQQIINDKSLLSGKVNPIIEEHMTFLRHNFPKEYSSIVNKIIEQKLKDSQQEILDVVYPVMGKMINKYINLQFQQLKESIDARINFIFSRQGMVRHLRNRILGIDSADLMLASLDVPILEEIFVVQKDTGLMLGSAALYPSVNRDVVAGMLTAIKSFVEDAFERENEDLEMIQYGTYRILIQTYPFYYFALALSGSVSSVESERLRGQVLDFIEKTDSLRIDDINEEVQNKISQELEEHFIISQRSNMQSIRLKPKVN